MRAGAVYEHKYLLGHFDGAPGDRQAPGGSRARKGADAVAHGCTGKGNDQVRFELAYQALAPELKVIAPWREWNLKSREDASTTRERTASPSQQTKEKIHSRDRNLWHISHEGGELEDPGNAPSTRHLAMIALARKKLPTAKRQSRSASRREFRFR